MKGWIYAVPLVVVLGMTLLFWSQLGKDPNRIESVLINKEVPPFDLPPLEGRERGFSSKDLLGQVSLVNIFGSWCVACQAEHRYLVRIQQTADVPIYGIDWREKDRTAGPRWLAKWGDPYTLVGDDPDSKASIAFGVTGAPESFIVDKKGVIRYKQIGPIDGQVWRKTLKPMIDELKKQ
ncbi:DsbE family thiol:disulfide interchange protein [Magnetospira sp. QH-2]|uniref:DsbE family thiol:disulfide interchange protein n=1 Tax=Magnetospira sp. (strain QH-2) TaxID=1288970 RepID=UPI0003E80FB6|nr:DsbE family thiol:disulfide interchange protein [Magnetospira sp. QH-2]CCQ75362.1 periplasmic thiol:disulfide interchange protein DsbE [Magnetospira sp. QH-2]